MPSNRPPIAKKPGPPPTDAAINKALLDFFDTDIPMGDKTVEWSKVIEAAMYVFTAIATDNPTDKQARFPYLTDNCIRLHYVSTLATNLYEDTSHRLYFEVPHAPIAEEHRSVVLSRVIAHIPLTLSESILALENIDAKTFADGIAEFMSRGRPAESWRLPKGFQTLTPVELKAQLQAVLTAFNASEAGKL